LVLRKSSLPPSESSPLEVMRKTFLEINWGRIHQLAVEGQAIIIGKLRFQLLVMLKFIMMVFPEMYLSSDRLEGTMMLMRSLLGSLRRGPDDDRLAAEEPPLFMELELKKYISKDLCNCRCTARSLWDILLGKSLNCGDKPDILFVTYTLKLATELVTKNAFSSDSEDCEVGLQLLSLMGKNINDHRYVEIVRPAFGMLDQMLGPEVTWVGLRVLDVLDHCEPNLTTGQLQCIRDSIFSLLGRYND
jgi:hypothetical protein